MDPDVCRKFPIDGYPHIRYFTDMTTKEGAKYEGGHNFKSMEKFVEKHRPRCGVHHKDLCSEEDLAFLEVWMVKTSAEREAEMASNAATIKAATAEFKTHREGLQKQFETGHDSMVAKIGAVKPGMEFIKRIGNSLSWDTEHTEAEAA